MHTSSTVATMDIILPDGRCNKPNARCCILWKHRHNHIVVVLGILKHIRANFHRGVRVFMYYHTNHTKEWNKVGTFWILVCLTSKAHLTMLSIKDVPIPEDYHVSSEWGFLYPHPLVSFHGLVPVLVLPCKVFP